MSPTYGPEYAFWGCECCADPNNHLFGHLEQICDRCSEAGSTVQISGTVRTRQGIRER
jgi:hypothetical protein